MIRRCNKILREYESKLHLVERFAKAKETVSEIQELSGVSGERESAGELQNRLERIGMLSRELLEEL